MDKNNGWHWNKKVEYYRFVLIKLLCTLSGYITIGYHCSFESIAHVLNDI